MQEKARISKTLLFLGLAVSAAACDRNKSTSSDAITTYNEAPKSVIVRSRTAPQALNSDLRLKNANANIGAVSLNEEIEFAVIEDSENLGEDELRALVNRQELEFKAASQQQLILQKYPEQPVDKTLNFIANTSQFAVQDQKLTATEGGELLGEKDSSDEEKKGEKRDRRSRETMVADGVDIRGLGMLSELSRVVAVPGNANRFRNYRYGCNDIYGYFQFQNYCGVGNAWSHYYWPVNVNTWYNWAYQPSWYHNYAWNYYRPYYNFNWGGYYYYYYNSWW